MSLVSRVASRTRLRGMHIRSFSNSTEGRSKGPDGKEYSSSKEIGNPISMLSGFLLAYIFLAWANPNSGPSQDDKSSNAWKWVYPVGFGLIIMGMRIILRIYLNTCFFVGSLVSRYRNKGKKEDSEDVEGGKNVINDRSIRMSQAMQRLDFATKPVDEKKRIRNEYDEEH